MADLEQLLREHLREELSRAPLPGGDPLPGIVSRAAARRRRRAALTAAVVVVTAAAAVTGLAALRGPSAVPPPVVTTPTPSGGATPTPSGTTGPSADALLLTGADLPSRVDPADLPLTWTAAPATGPGTCLTGHLPSGLVAVAGTDLVGQYSITTVSPRALLGQSPPPISTYRYRQVVLDAGSPAAATGAAAALTARLDACRNVDAAQFKFPGEPGSPYLPTQVTVAGGGTAVLATWPKLAGSNASNDEYVGFTVAGRYLVTLSLPVQEKDQKNLTLSIAAPLQRLLARSGNAPSPTPTSAAADGGQVLRLTAADLPERVFSGDEPLTWIPMVAAGLGPCLTGHLPTGLTTVASTGFQAPWAPPSVGTDGSRLTFLYPYSETVLDAGSPTAAVAAARTLGTRLDTCRNTEVSWPTRVTFGDQGIAVLATYPGSPGSHASDDEYVGLAVAGRYLVVLSMPLLEQSHTDLETAIAEPLTRVLARAGNPGPGSAQPPTEASVALTLSVDSPPDSADVTISAAATGRVPATVEAPPATGPLITGHPDQGLLATRLAWGDGATDGSDPGSQGCRADTPLVPLDIGPLHYQHRYTQPGTYTITYLRVHLRARVHRLPRRGGQPDPAHPHGHRPVAGLTPLRSRPHLSSSQRRGARARCGLTRMENAAQPADSQRPATGSARRSLRRDLAIHTVEATPRARASARRTISAADGQVREKGIAVSRNSG